MDDALFAAKLRALVRARWQVDHGVVGTFPGGATMHDGGVGWVLVGDDPARRLGGALAWARQQRLAELHVLVDDPSAAGILARRAALFARAPHVWRIDGTTLSLAPAAAPAAFDAPPPSAELFRPLLRDAGLEVVTEGAELVGERAGLEVARVTSPPGDDGGARLEIGVGRFDREAFSLMNADLPQVEALAKAVAVVAEHRRPGALRHQLNQLVPERWMRSELVTHPARVGAASLVPVESAWPRTNLRQSAPASALGVGHDGRPLLVVCSVGIDLDLVPCAADDRLAHEPEARLVLALAEADVLPVTEALAVALLDPAEIVVVPAGPWSASASA